MKVQAQHVFYFDFMLPDFEKPDDLQIDLRVNFEGNYTALILGWNRSDPLFLNDIGETLSNSGFTIQPLWAPGGGLTYRVRDVVVDRLIVALEWETDDNPAEDPLIAQLWLDRAVSTANYVLGHLRAVTGVARIQPIRRYWSPGHHVFSIQIPYTVTWFNQTDGTDLAMYDGMNSFCSTGGITAPHTGRAKIEDLGASMAPGGPPPLHLSLLVDAEEALMSLNLREAILSIASACEMRANSYIDDQELKTSKDLKSSSSKRMPFAEKYFHELPMTICGRSFKTEYPAEFTEIQDCYLIRNQLMHGGHFREPFKSLPEIERYRKVLSWQKAARQAVKWIEILPLN